MDVAEYLYKTSRGYRPGDMVPILYSRIVEVLAEITRLNLRVDELLRSNNDFEQRRRDAVSRNRVLVGRVAALHRQMETFLTDATAPVIARPIDEYHEDMGAVLWWKFPITEPPYVGTPLDLGHTISVTVGVGTVGGYPEAKEGPNARMTHYSVGGWPGYHTHFTPIPLPQAPEDDHDR